MPTENRSSNAEMVSVPRHIGRAPLNGRHYVAECVSCGWVGSSCELTEDALCARLEGDSMCLSDADEIGADRLLAMVQAMAHAAEQHQGGPVAVVDESDDGLFIDFIYGENGNPLRRGDKLYTHSDAGEVERLREALGCALKSAENINAEVIALSAKLAERDALLRGLVEYADGLLSNANDAWSFAGSTGTPESHKDEDYARAVALLSASAEPSAPKCSTCKGNGVVGWQRGQTPEQFEQGGDECGDCLGTGYAHCQGMPVPGTCTTCEGKGHVPDGAITGVGGVEFENGPVECIKDCPDCAPVERDERAEFEVCIRREWPMAPISRKRDLLPKGDPCYGDYCDEPLQRARVGWQMRAALERKPATL